MNRPLLSFAVAAALTLGVASCTPNDKTTTTDSTTDNAAAAADTAGAKASMAGDKAGVQMDSASTKMMDKTGGASTSADAATAPGATK